MSDLKKIRIGTRGSPLALRQTEIVRAELARVRPDVSTEVVIIKTSGDWTPEQGEQPLDRKGGGKALFAKEIEEQLLAGKIDAAVHSMKDMDSNIPSGLVIDCMLPREDVRDAVILREENPQIRSLKDLPENAVIGTCSLRRQGFLLRARPDLKIETLRGNVGTRLEKLQAGKMAGILLAKAGLNRLNMAKKASFLVPFEEMLPCGGQGAIGIEIKQNSHDVLAVFGQIKCLESLLRVKCERAALAKLGGSCHTPVGSYAEFTGKELWLRTCLVSPDGQQIYAEEGRVDMDIMSLKNQMGSNTQSDEYLEAKKGALMIAERLGYQVGERLQKRVPKELL